MIQIYSVIMLMISMDYQYPTEIVAWKVDGKKQSAFEV
jgi:hypothetical protein